jgi:hypothetical protein
LVAGDVSVERLGVTLHCSNALLRNRTPACDTSALHSARDSALYPIISQIERAAGFTHDDTAQAKLNKVDALAGAEFYTTTGRRT